jgi:murein DD-endopeptidase MepM/ murein hydrolase activator NlpD
MIALGSLALVVAACSSASGELDDDVIIQTVTPTAGRPETTAVPSSTQALPAAPTAAPTATAPAPDLRGFGYPIAGACLPKGDQLMPNAPRPYRNGIHEGVDFYDVDNCTRIGRGTDVLAAKPGRVIRADTAYVDPTPDQLRAYLADPNTETSFDAFRGRQVWVDHGGGVVTRYCHLLDVAPGIVQGTQVAKGQLIAHVGESGTPESITNPGHQYHLHFEIRVGAGYLGKDLPAAQVRALYVEAFTP